MKIDLKLFSFLICFTALPTQAAVLYSQPYDGSTSAYASQNDTTGGNGNFATAYDNFTLATSANITGVQWTGGYFGGSPASISDFTIQLWADNAGQPGASLLSQSGFGSANETLLSGEIYTYAVALPSSFLAQAGTQYWLSIVPDLGYPPQWGWATATGGDGVAYQDFLGTRSSLATTDFAFSLTGTAVPEPTTILLFGTGLIGLIGANRRRQKIDA